MYREQAEKGKSKREKCREREIEIIKKSAIQLHELQKSAIRTYMFCDSFAKECIQTNSRPVYAYFAIRLQQSAVRLYIFCNSIAKEGTHKKILGLNKKIYDSIAKKCESNTQVLLFDRQKSAYTQKL